MVTDPRFDPEPTYTEAPPRERSGCKSCLMGCGIVGAVLLVLMIIAGFWVYSNWRDLFAAGTTAVVQQQVEATQLPAEEKQQIMAEVKRLTEAIRAGDVSAEQSALLWRQIIESPLLKTLAVVPFEKVYFDNSGLTDEEKAEGRQTLSRFLEGVFDGKIPNRSIDEVLSHIADRLPDGSWVARENVNDADLKECLASAKEAADKAEIPDEPEAVDPSEELKKMIDAALQEP